MKPRGRSSQGGEPPTPKTASDALLKVRGPIHAEISATGDIHVRFLDASGRPYRIELDEFQWATLVASTARLHEESDAKPFRQVYVDESIHVESGFIATAMVFAQYDLGPRVARELKAAGLDPGDDEHKSGTPMSDAPELQRLRDRIQDIAALHTSIVVVFSPANSRRSLGKIVVESLIEAVTKNGIKASGLEVFVDQGISPPSDLVTTGTPLDGVTFHFDTDSRTVLGVQVADEVAHATAVILKDELRGESKLIDIGGEDTGYGDGTKAALEWLLRMNHRYAFFTRPVVLTEHSADVDPLTDPLIIDDDDGNAEGGDYIDQSQHPELFGWGIFASGDCSNEFRTAVKRTFAKIWLGCIH